MYVCVPVRSIFIDIPETKRRIECRPHLVAKALVGRCMAWNPAHVPS